jgi:hypothetical protein
LFVPATATATADWERLLGAAQLDLVPAVQGWCWGRA